ncbi:hypothetical protein F5884DRAFT_683898 [Xylogone sp. PMI_703]|nr:hypothetical protein F5884DRAFT_683898 [Xylogone sp. PMI_703]
MQLEETANFLSNSLSQSDGFDVAINNRVEGEQNSRTEDRPHNPEALQAGPPTDSGYASITHNKLQNAQTEDRTQRNEDVQFRPADEKHASATNNTCESAQHQEIQELDDARTVYSDASSLSALEKEKYKSEIAQDLFNKVRTEQVDDQAMERITKILPEMLKAFALKIGHNPLAQICLDIMVFVHKYRNDIVRYFKEGYSQMDKGLPGATTDPSNMPLNDKMNLWYKKVEDMEDVMGTDLDIDPKEELEEEDNDTPEFLVYRGFIFETPAYEWLLANLRRELVLTSTEPNSIEDIRREITHSLPSSHKVSRKKSAEAYKVTFQVRWDPFGFIKEQEYKEEPDEVIEIVITLTGSSKDAQALTCTRYLCQTWPSSGKHIIRLVKNIICSGPGHRHSCDLPDNTKLTAWVQGSEFMVEVFGTGGSVAEIGEQLAWLGAALRSSPYELGVTYCTPFISDIRIDSTLSQVPKVPSGHDILCKIDFMVQEKEEHLKLSSGQCWHNLFRNPVVVKGFPIPRKSEPDTGLEIPLNMLAGLARTQRVSNFNRQFFIKGFSTMLVPTRNNGDLFIWHLLYNKDGSHISYLDNTVPHADNITDFDLEKARHIIGWCSEVKYCAGAADAKYPEKETALHEPHQGCALENVSVRYGKLITKGDLYAIGHKDTPVHISRDGDIPKLKWIHEKFVVLWDEEEKRGWLVNGTSALLHLLRASLHYDSSDPFSSVFRFKREDMQEAHVQYTAHSAISVLLNHTNMELEIYPEKKGHIRFKDRVEHFYDVLDKIITHQDIVARQGHESSKSRPRKYLEGWDFRDLARIRDPIYPRMVRLQAIGKGWVDFTRAINAVTLFGNGFGEIFRPADTNNLCAHWTNLPKERYYLAACVSDLKNIIVTDGIGKANPITRDKKIIWHDPDEAFEPCLCMGRREEHSDFVQVLLPSKFGKSLKLNPLKINQILQKGCGAVIFGHNKKFGWFWKDTGDPEEGETPLPSEESESESESEPEFKDSGIELSPGSSAVEGSSRCEVFTREHYKIGIVCALPKELKAIRALYDSKHGHPVIPAEDTNHYALGQIGEHNIVAACLPFEAYGTNSAADVISNMRRSFIAIKFYLLVGIGGGVPLNNDIRLGDVVVSTPKGANPGVIQYDFGKVLENGVFERTGCLQNPPRFLMTAISSLMSKPHFPYTSLQEYITKVTTTIQEYKHPGSDNDRLFASECIHDSTRMTCEQCDGPRIERDHRLDNYPRIHYGLIASGNQLMKNAQIRDNLAKEHKVLCFEMEAAGVMNSVPCLVIRGICDYADSHKNDLWQEYASATAAAYAKLLLSIVRSRNDMESTQEDLETVKSSRSRKRPVPSPQLTGSHLRKKLQK